MFRNDLINLVRTTFNNFENYNILLNRNGIEYKTEGRLQNLEQSKEIDEMTLKELVLARQSYSMIQTNNYDMILESVLARINMMSYED